MTRGAPGALLLLVLAVAGCGRAAPGVIATGPAWHAAITTAPWPPRGIMPHRLIVTFDGRRAEGPVRLRMRMPSMSHEATTVSLHATGAGRYEATVAFDMAGSWELTLLVGAPAQEASATLAVQP